MIYNERFELQVTIRSFPKHRQINWFKGSKVLDINQFKNYKSSCNGDTAVLCIEHVTKDDENIYRVEVWNDLGKSTSENITLKVVGGKLFFPEYIHCHDAIWLFSKTFKALVQMYIYPICACVNVSFFFMNCYRCRKANS